jgi:hypothetical protein
MKRNKERKKERQTITETKKEEETKRQGSEKGKNREEEKELERDKGKAMYKERKEKKIEMGRRKGEGRGAPHKLCRLLITRTSFADFYLAVVCRKPRRRRVPWHHLTKNRSGELDALKQEMEAVPAIQVSRLAAKGGKKAST